MNKIKVSLDKEEFWSKPTERDIPRINQRIGGSVKELCSTDIRKVAENIAIDGQTFCPATFKNGIRKKILNSSNSLLLILTTKTPTKKYLSRRKEGLSSKMCKFFYRRSQ